MKDIQTGLMFTPVPTDYLDAVWSNVAKVLKKSVGTAKGKYEVNDLYPLVKNDELVLWIVADHDKDDEIIAAITTRLILYPQSNAMAMDWIGGKRMMEWLPIAMEKLSSFAKDCDCSHLEGYGRKAWMKILKKYNWEPEYIAYRMEINNG